MVLPRVVYVYENKESDGTSYLIASIDPDDQDEGLVGVYDLREILHVRHKTQFRRAKNKLWFDKA